MTEGTADPDLDLLYQADEKPPPRLALGLGLQYALLSLGGIVLIPMIAYRAAGSSEPVLAWAVFVSLLVSGVITALNAFPVGRFGAGYVLVAGPTSAALAVSVDALAAGGASLLLSLVVASALFQLIFSYRISMFRRIITPTVSGIILMLLPVTIAPIVFGKIAEVPAGRSQVDGLVCAFVTLAVIVFVSLKGRRRLRPWAPLIGIVAGAMVAVAYGLYDMGRVAQAAWIGLPSTAWRAPEIDFGPSFWGLLPAFLLVAISCSIRTMSASLAIQDVSWKTVRATNLRAVQGAVAADAMANLLSGLGGTMPNATRSTTVALTRITRVGARSLGIGVGLALVAIAFLPKVIALVLALPAAVLSAYITMMIAALFVTGMKMVVADGLDQRRVMITGLSFWIGAGCQYGLLLPDILPQFLGGLLNNGLSSGGLTAILMTLLLEMTEGKRQRLEIDLDVSCLPQLREFVARFTSAKGWSRGMGDRLDLVAEETLLTLIQNQPDSGQNRRRLRVTAHRESGEAVLEFVARSGDSNIEDRIALLGDTTDARPVERDISLRLLRHLASNVRHRQYHDADFITVRVEAPEGTERAKDG